MMFKIKRGLWFCLIIGLLIGIQSAISEHTADISLKSTTPDPVYELNEVKIKIDVENLETSSHSINKIIINTTLLDITSANDPSSWSSLISEDNKSVEWYGGSIHSDFLGRFTFYVTVPDLVSNQTETIAVKTEDDNGEFQFNDINISLLMDSAAPTYVLNSPQENSFVKDGSLLFNVTFTEEESGLDYSLIHYGYFDTATKNSSTTALPLDCIDNDCLSTHTTENSNLYLGFYFEIVDLAGNKDHTDWSDAAWYFMYIDSEAPTLTINTADSVSTNSNEYNFNYDLSENTFTVGGDFNPLVECLAYLVDESYTESLVGSKTLTYGVAEDDLTANLDGLTEGLYQWYMECTDSAGWAAASTQRDITLDYSAPNIAITSHENESVVNNQTYIKFTIDDELGDVENVWSNYGPLDWSDGFFQIHSSQFNQDYNLLQIYANDTVGNINNEEFTIYVDSQKPNVSLISPDDGETIINDVVRFTATDDYSTVLNCSLYVEGNLERNDLVNSSQNSWNLNRGDGTYTWNITCTDDVGNTGNSARTVTINTPKAPSNGNGDSGGGTTTKNIELKEKTITPETDLKTKSENIIPQEELSLETICDYTLEISLPESISFLEQESYDCEITNRGNCDIQKLDLHLDTELNPFIDFSQATIIDLNQGNKSKLQVIRKTEKKEWPISLFTGSAIAERMMAKKISGIITIKGTNGEESVFTQDLPVNIEVLAPEKMIWTIKLALPGTGFIALLTILTVFLIKRRFIKNKDPFVPWHKK